MEEDFISSEEEIQRSLTRVIKGGSLILVALALSQLFGFLRQFSIIRPLSPAIVISCAVVARLAPIYAMKRFPIGVSCP